MGIFFHLPLTFVRLLLSVHGASHESISRLVSGLFCLRTCDADDDGAPRTKNC